MPNFERARSKYSKQKIKETIFEARLMNPRISGVLEVYSCDIRNIRRGIEDTKFLEKIHPLNNKVRKAVHG